VHKHHRVPLLRLVSLLSSSKTYEAGLIRGGLIFCTFIAIDMKNIACEQRVVDFEGAFFIGNLLTFISVCFIYQIYLWINSS
jgi:hypothetical protein